MKTLQYKCVDLPRRNGAVAFQSEKLSRGVVEMRKAAIVKNGHPDVARVMIYEEDNSSFYLFTHSSLQDGPSTADYWYSTLEEAEKVCAEKFGISDSNWARVEDCLEGCQHDWIAPVRVKGRETGAPQWGIYERLEHGVWKEILDI